MPTLPDTPGAPTAVELPAISIQSLSKLFALALALQREGDLLWRRVAREPSGTPFNSLVLLERDRGIPRYEGRGTAHERYNRHCPTLSKDSG